MPRLLVPMLLLSALAACGSPSGPPPRTAAVAPVDPSQGAHGGSVQPAIHVPSQPLQCVPFARAHSGIEIHGDAWTWWGQADDRYPRGDTPRVGAVVALQVNHDKRGHLAVVREVRGPRTIVVDHANWLNRGRIHRNTPMVDVSPDNDWSRVRVWYTPGGHLGGSVYPVHGFIYPDRTVAAGVES